VLFGIFLSAFLIGLVLLFVLEINDVSKSDTGMLIATDKPKEYVVTSSVSLVKLHVSEGDEVQIGDTIAEFKSNDLLGKVYQQMNSIQIEEQRVSGLSKSIDILEKQIRQTKLNKGLLSSSQSTSKESKIIALNSLKAQIDIYKSNLEVLQNRIAKDAELMKKGAISQVDYQKRKQQLADEQNELTRLEGRYLQAKVELNDIDSSQNRDMGNQDISLLNLEADLLKLQKERDEAELSLFQMRQVEVALRTEIENLVILADMNGSITSLFNAVNNRDILSKGAVVAKVSPLGSTNYYAKLIVSEEGLRDVEIGQEVNIKLNAYNHYQYGVLKGKVFHIDKEVNNEMTNFYVLAELDTYDPEVFKLKDGYQISGEIILKTIKLNKYIAGKIFKKIQM